MRALVRFATPILLPTLLCACTLRGATAPAPAPQQAAAPAALLGEAEVCAALNTLVNDTIPGSTDDAARRAALAKDLKGGRVPESLSWTVSQTVAFNPPQLARIWSERQKAEGNAAAGYTAAPPQNYAQLKGGVVERRLGPELYLVRMTSGESALLSTSRKLRDGARLNKLLAAEQSSPRPDKHNNDLVDELSADQFRRFVEISRDEARRRETMRSPALAGLRALRGQDDASERAMAADLARVDTLTREVNAVISPRLLPQGTAPTVFIHNVRRMAKTFSQHQYYRYALPVTDAPQVDAVLQGYLNERRDDVQHLLRSTGVGHGRTRTNTDRIIFTTYTASPRLLSIRFQELRDTGGAHPNTTFASFVFDMRTHRLLRLADLFTDEPTALKLLSELATRRLEMALDGTTFPEGYAPRAENFSVFVLDGADLVFTFPPYQVASYAQGPQTLRVPLCHPRLLPLLSPALREALATK